MFDRPDISDLLTAAQQELANKLLPHLDAEQRQVAMRITRALAIVERGMASSEQSARAALQRLRALGAHLPELTEAIDQAAAAERPMSAQLDAGAQVLKVALRAGAFDDAPELQRELLHHLAATAEDRLRINNPQKLY